MHAAENLVLLSFEKNNKTRTHQHIINFNAFSTERSVIVEINGFGIVLLVISRNNVSIKYALTLSVCSISFLWLVVFEQPGP